MLSHVFYDISNTSIKEISLTFNPIPSRHITFQMIIDANQYVVTCLIETLQEHANGTATVQCNSVNMPHVLFRKTGY